MHNNKIKDKTIKGMVPQLGISLSITFGSQSIAVYFSDSDDKRLPYNHKLVMILYLSSCLVS